MVHCYHGDKWAVLHHLSLVSDCSHHFCKSCLIRPWYIFFSRPILIVQGCRWINYMNKEAVYGKNYACGLKLVLYDASWCRECEDFRFVVIFDKVEDIVAIFDEVASGIFDEHYSSLKAIGVHSKCASFHTIYLRCCDKMGNMCSYKKRYHRRLTRLRQHGFLRSRAIFACYLSLSLPPLGHLKNK